MSKMGTYSCNGQSTNRDISDYIRLLGINIEDLKGKSVLDIGASYGKFQKECKEKHGIDVIALDPSYVHNGELKKYLEFTENRKNKIAGINESLPFIQNSFDVVLCNFSSFFYICDNYPNIKHRLKMAEQMFKEIFRVLKSRGEARIGGIPEIMYNRQIYESILKQIKKQFNSKVDWKFVEEPDYLILYRD